MNNQRDELRGTLANTVCNALNYPERARPYLLGGDMGTVLDKAADAILAAGYRKPRTVSTVAELDALPEGSIVQGDWSTYQLILGSWATLGSPAKVTPTLPASVLYEPEGK